MVGSGAAVLASTGSHSKLNNSEMDENVYCAMNIPNNSKLAVNLERKYARSSEGRARNQHEPRFR